MGGPARRLAAAMLAAAAVVIPPLSAGADPPAGDRGACRFAHRREVREVPVRDPAGLAAALRDARPGDLILLSPGVYRGRFRAAASGTREAPIVLCGPRGAVLDGGTVTRGYGLHLTGSHWVLRGFTVTRAKKGIMLDGASHNLLERLEIAEIGNEGVHFRAGSSDNVLRGSSIHDTGRTGDPHHGEGVYVGSFHAKWCQHSACGPDRSDRNQILDNRIARTTAEAIDVKEGTSDGVIRGNVFLGDRLAPPGADSWVDVKGNGWTVERNRGTTSPGDGFQVHARIPGWGRNNVFRANVAKVGGPGYGFKVEPAAGNVVACDNVSTSAARGLANVPCAR